MQWNNVQAFIRKQGPAMILMVLVGTGGVSVAAPLTETEVLSGLATNIIKDQLAQTVTASQVLMAAADGLCDRQDGAALQAAQSAWIGAYLAWRKAQPSMLQGKQNRAEALLDQWPTNEVVLDGPTSSPELASLLNDAEVRGFSAADTCSLPRQVRLRRLRSNVAVISGALLVRSSIRPGKTRGNGS